MDEGAVIRVAICCPVPAVRMGLRAMLESDLPASSDVRVVFEAPGLHDVVGLAGGFDLLALVSDGISVEETRIFKKSFEQRAGESFSLLLLADQSAAARLLPVPGLHSWGILSLDAGASELNAAVRALHEGLAVASPVLLAALLPAHPGGAELALDDMVESLTARESQVLALVARDLANKQIASDLAISEHTVKFHVSSIYTKLGAANRAEAVRIGLLRGLVTL